MIRPQENVSMRAKLSVLALVLAALAASGAEAATRYIAFGDSITAAWGFDEACNCGNEDCEGEAVCACQQLCGYPRRLRTRLTAAGEDAAVLNRGLGGEKTLGGLTRLDEVLAADNGDVLLLMEGTNDISTNVSPETTQDNLREMANKATLAGLETIHVTLIPRIPTAKEDPENVANAAMARRLRDLAFTTGKQLVDPYEVFSSTPGLFEELYAESETDKVGHPNARGYDLLTDAFFDVLTGADNVPPVLGDFEPADGAVDVGPLEPVRVRLYDFGTAGIDSFFTRLLLNGQQVATGGVAGGSIWMDLEFAPTTPHPPEVTARVESRDLNLNGMERRVTTFTIDQEAPGPCIASATTLCIDDELGDQRFQVTIHFKTVSNGVQEEGEAPAQPLAPIGLRRGGLFSFFDEKNPEILVKVLNGCGRNNRFWVFVAPTTTVGYEIKIVDTVAGQLGAPRSETTLVVTNKDGVDAPPFSSTSAFPTCELSSSALAGGGAAE